MKRFWNRYWFDTVAAGRPYLLIRGVLLALAFDTWTELIPHGGRYGHGGFNVAHFTILDSVQPTPTPSLYVGLLILVGLLAFASALGRLYRPVLASVAALYTWSWSMSMIDSYQHHYLLSLVLGLFVTLPIDGAGSPFAHLAGKRTSGWGLHLLSVTVGLVYGWTMVSKLEPDWRSGAAMTRIAGSELRAVHDWLGANPNTLGENIRLLGPSVAALQLVIALGYFASPLACTSRLARYVAIGGWIGSILFHTGAEFLGLEIGWFSGYMLFISSVLLLPNSAIDAVVRVVEVPSQWWRRSRRFTVDIGDVTPLSLSLAIGAGAILLTVGARIDLPGARGVSWVATAVLLGGRILALRFNLAKKVAESAIVATVAAAAFWASVSFSDTRFDFYRFLGGAHWRVGAWTEALAAYEKANRYAPEGTDRRAAEREARTHVNGRR